MWLKVLFLRRSPRTGRRGTRPFCGGQFMVLLPGKHICPLNKSYKECYGTVAESEGVHYGRPNARSKSYAENMHVAAYSFHGASVSIL
jgi:hypothetical protein